MDGQACLQQQQQQQLGNVARADAIPAVAPAGGTPPPLTPTQPENHLVDASLVETKMSEQFRAMMGEMMTEVKTAMGGINSSLQGMRMEMATQANQIRFLENIVQPPEAEPVLSDGEGEGEDMRQDDVFVAPGDRGEAEEKAEKALSASLHHGRPRSRDTRGSRKLGDGWRGEEPGTFSDNLPQHDFHDNTSEGSPRTAFRPHWLPRGAPGHGRSTRNEALPGKGES